MFRVTLPVAATAFCLSGHAAEQLPDIEYFQNDNVTNQIPYFDNRFRIDAELDEVTLVFFRRSGTPPIILVQPDGKKLKVNNIKTEDFQWYDDKTFDMIKLKKPMPGPWQAIGNILPESRIMVMSEVSLAVEPLPEVLLEGETIKVTGRLYNGERAINDPEFREVVQLDVDFYSTNDAVYDNYGAEPIKLDSFRDDGYELDEYAGDGIFTGEFELDFAPGEWQPIYLVKLPMASRKLQQKPIIIRHSPIRINVETGDSAIGKHIATFTIDPKYVDPDSIIMQGKITFPDKQVEPFSIMEGKGTERIKEIAFTEGGVHRITTGVFGKTIDGREFRLVLPEFSFNVDREAENMQPQLTPEQAKEAREREKAEKAAARVRALEEAKLQKEMQQAEQQKQMYMIVGIGNLVIILIAAIGFFIYKKRKAKKSA